MNRTASGPRGTTNCRRSPGSRSINSSSGEPSPHGRRPDVLDWAVSPLRRGAVGHDPGDASLKTGIRETLESLEKSHGYANVILAGVTGAVCSRSTLA